MFSHPSAKGKSIFGTPQELVKSGSKMLSVPKWLLGRASDKGRLSGGFTVLSSWKPHCTHKLLGTLTPCQAPLGVPIPILLLSDSHLNSILLQKGGPGYSRYAICSSAPFPKHVQERMAAYCPLPWGK